MTVHPIEPTGFEALRGPIAPVLPMRPELRILPGGRSEVAEHEAAEPALRVDAEVLAEVAELREQGYDVHVVFPEQQVADTNGTGERVREVTNRLVDQDPEEAKRILFDGVKYRAQTVWHRLSKRAIALHTLYLSKRSDILGEGINPEVYDRPLFSGQSARQVLAARRGGAKADGIVGKYQDFVSPDHRLEDAVDEHGLTQGDYLAHVIDSRAVRTRATAAANAIKLHFTRRKLNGDDRPIRSASLACGAAGPIYEIVTGLESEGHDVTSVMLVDQDPMALATAVSYGEHVGVDGKLDVQLRDLIRDKLTDYIAPHSVSVVDLLGFFEYIPDRVTPRGLARLALSQMKPNQERQPEPGFMGRLKSLALNGLQRYAERPERDNPVHYKAAADILGSLKDIVEPGGLIVFGNMLNKRPDQAFFKAVWPELHQRSVSEVLQIIADAGYDPKKDVTVEIPGEEGVYAVYTIRIPEQQKQQRSPSQFVGRWILKNVIADY